MANSSTHIRTDKKTLEKLRAMAPAGNVSQLLRDIANGNHKLELDDLTNKDLAVQIGAVQSHLIKKINELAILFGSTKKVEE